MNSFEKGNCIKCNGKMTRYDKTCPHCGADFSSFISKEMQKQNLKAARKVILNNLKEAVKNKFN